MSINIFDDYTNRSLITHINLSYSNMCSSLEKLSSGLKINSAADGPAQLVISEQLRSQIASLNQQIENTSSLVHKYETASANLAGYRNQLTELRTLAVGAANGGFNSEEAQQAYAMAAESIVSNYNEAVATASYNGATLFDGGEGSVGEVGALSGIDLSSPEAAVASIEVIDAAASEIDALQVDVGSTQSYDLESELATLRITSENLQAAESSIRDTDFVVEFTNFLVEQMKFKAGLALLSYTTLSSTSVLNLFRSS